MTDYDDGISRVRNSNGDFAFSLSYDSAVYELEQEPCDLMMVGVHGPGKGESGLGVYKGDPFLKRLDDAIDIIKKNGKYDEIRKKWLSDGPCKGKRILHPETSGAGLAAPHIFDTILLAYILSAFY